jgi:hypothetical protein
MPTLSCCHHPLSHSPRPRPWQDYMGQVPQVLRYLLAGAAKDDGEVKLKEVRGPDG